ncbi:MAG: NfeD family protein, partial [Candidatus Paceibacterales bacterium]
IVLLLLVFASSYVAGLAGYEAVLIFVLGVVLIGVEFFLFPGTLIPGVLGIILILGSLVWAIADTWPNQRFEFKGEIFLPALRDVLGAFVVAFICALLIGRYFLKGWFWNRLVLKQSVPAAAGVSTVASTPKIGDTALTVTGLYPSGEIEVDHRRYQARAIIGMIEDGVRVEIVGKDGFAFIVKKQEK